MTRKLIVPVLIAAILFVGLTVGVNAQTFWQRFDNVLVKSLESTGNVQVDGALNVVGALTGSSANFTSGISTDSSVVAYGSSSIGTFLSLTPGAMIAVTPDSTITPLASYQPISSTAAVGTSSIAAMAAGTVLQLHNIGAQTVTLTDTGTLYLSGNIALGANDSLTLISKGVGEGWVQVSTSNN